MKTAAHAPPSSQPPARASVVLARGAMLGAVAGAAAAALDVASTVLWLTSRGEQARLTLAALALGTSATSLLGALAGLAFTRVGASWRARAVRIAALHAVPLAVVAWLLFTGGRARHVPALVLVRPVVFASLLALATVFVTLSARATLAARRASGRSRIAVALVALGLAVTMHALDHRVLPRLYEYLHAALGALTALSLASVATVLAPRVPRGRTGLVTVACALTLLPASLFALDRWDNARAEIFGVHAPYVHHLLVALEALRPRAARASTSHDPSVVASTLAGLPALASPHVLLITVDAMRADRLAPRYAPHLSALAAHGWHFTRAYAQAPHSSYSIASTLTSEYLHETVPLGQPQPRTTLPDALTARGYYTAALYTNGIFFTEGERLGPYRDRDFGFRRADHGDRRADAQADVALREIDDVLRRGEPPTLLWVHFFDAHEPYSGDGATPLARYDAAIGTVDLQADRVVAAARARFTRPVVVVLAADHGEEFGEHGGVYHGTSLYEEQVRVPLVIDVPGLAPAVIDAPVELTDLAPTLLPLCGAPTPATMRGHDLRALASGRENAAWPAFSAVNTHTMVVRWPYKLVADLRYEVTELYDLSRDPDERTSLAEADGARAASLRDDIAGWIDALGASAAGRAAIARGRMGERRAIPDLVALALDPHEREAVRIEAIDALAAFDDPAAVAPLAPLLASSARDLGDHVAGALGGVARDPRALARLRDAVRRDEPDARIRASLALARLARDADALEPLREALATGDEATRFAAVDALGWLRLRDALEPLLSVVDDSHLRYRVVLALGRIADPTTFARLATIAVADRAEDVRADAVAALAVAHDRDAIPLLERLAHDAPSLPYTVSSLGLLGALGREIPGWDARDPSGATDLTDCGETREPGLVWRYLRAHACTAARGDTTLTVARPARPFTLVVRLQNAEPVTVSLDGTVVAQLAASEASLRESRIAATPASTTGAITIRLHSATPFSLGHVALVPRSR